MTREVWKFDLGDVTGVGDVVEMPFGARILDVREQADRACLWAEVDPSAMMLARAFTLVLTGEPIPDAAEFVGSIHTVDALDADFVVHVYEATSNAGGARSSRAKDDLREAQVSTDERGRGVREEGRSR